MFTTLILLLASWLPEGTATPHPLALATTFSYIANELNDVSLRNCSLVDVKLPLNDTKAELPHPQSNLALKYITLGRGTQRYTCASSNSTCRGVTTPKAVGAATTLFDASCLASASTTLLHEVPAIIGRAPLGALALMTDVLGAITNTTDLILGQHYLDRDGTQFFDLRASGLNTWMAAETNASVSAPRRKYSRKTESKDVAWLRFRSAKGQGIKVSTLQLTSWFQPALADQSSGSLSSHDLWRERAIDMRWAQWYYLSRLRSRILVLWVMRKHLAGGVGLCLGSCSMTGYIFCF